MKRIYAGAVAILVGFSLLLSGCVGLTESQPLGRYQGSFLELFDTVTFVVGYAKTEEVFEKTMNELKSELTVYHQLYDIYNDYPDVANVKTINDNAGMAPVVVDQKIIDLLLEGKEVYAKTDGLTNIAMGSVLTLWHDARDNGIENPEKAVLPDKAALDEAAKHMDISQVIIDEQASTVYLADPHMSLDVGSLGKGYATERVAQWLEEKGVDQLLLSVGGNVRAIGTKPDGALWETGVENPYGEQDYMAVVQMNGTSLVISGDYQRYYTVDGKRYHHIINPKTLMPENEMSAVAIICKDSGLADGYSTAVFNMPYEEGLAWVDAHPEVEAMWMFEDRTVAYSSGFEEYKRA